MVAFFPCSVDEKTSGFKGRHVDKMRISYKNEGSRFQSGALCNLGYNYVVFFSN